MGQTWDLICVPRAQVVLFIFVRTFFVVLVRLVFPTYTILLEMTFDVTEKACDS